MRPRGAGPECVRLLTVFALVCVLGSAWRARGADEPAPPTPLRTATELFSTFAPAIVRVNIVTDDLDETGKPARLTFTGFFISHEGRVLTSLGDSTRVSRVWIEKDGLDYAAQYLGGDVRTHLALIQALRMPETFAVIPIDGSRPLPPIGSPVVALSQPLEVDVSPSPGWVTGSESGFAQFIFPCSYLRTNIPLGPGDGGAPVLDAGGHLAGVMVSGVPALRASYLVTPHSLKRIVGDLAQHGKVIYGTLPVEFAEGPDSLYVARQVVVSKVTPEGSADRAGIRPGDVLKRLGDTPIRRIADVRDVLFNARPGEFLRIELEREGRAIPFFTLPVEALREDVMPAEKPPAPEPAKAIVPDFNPGKRG